MHHAARAAVRSLSLWTYLLGFALAGCAPDADPAPTPGTTVPPGASGDGDATRAPADDPPTFLAPGELTVRWGFSEPDLAAACQARHVTTVRLEVGLDAPAVVDCATGARRYAELPAGMYSVGVVLLDAKGAVVAERYEAVLLRSGASMEVRTAF